jgi:hypothetical protein
MQPWSAFYTLATCSATDDVYRDTSFCEAFVKPLLAATIIPPALISPNLILRYSNRCLICSDDSSSLCRREFFKQALQRIEIC